MTDCPRAVLRPGVTRKRVDEGRLPNEQTQLEVIEALRCVGKGHTGRDCSLSLSHKDQNVMEMPLGDDMV